ncbi:PadR family transcriptional regulator [Nocardia arthritidis]|uniref:PadR family transcriptional regulator n=1 Tax=Nocardia arthritidis TaxID=228602 RepID=A0A6G9YRN2_9NOCA|nr:helix-turn-helix transcriptional regulator [Nocardia arthritidis]QIS15676.1 PadR family transcriptional regulator [Nocardia arthritidis]
MRADELRGHLDGLVLAVLERAPLHGYGVSQALALRSGGAIDVPSGTIYPALHRLERAGAISSDWASADGRKRRVYTITARGRRDLAEQRAAWAEFSSTISTVFAAR